MRKLSFILVPLLLIACTDSQPVAPIEEGPLFNNAGGLGAFQETVDIAGEFDLCGEVVDYTGQTHRSIRDEVDPSGGWHFFLNMHHRIWFVGQTTGWVWRYNDTTNQQFYWDLTDFAPDQWYIINEHIQIVGLGDAPNYNVRTQEHYTVNANGDLVSYIDFSDPECD
jgi:hypothetical protein